MSQLEMLMGAAGVGGAEVNWIDDVFSTYLYTGNSSTQTITNGIDLAGEGGLVWIKARSNVSSNTLYDTARGNTKSLYSNTTNNESTAPAGTDLSGFNSNGFSLGPDFLFTVNYDTYTYASWTFRKAPKFFDVVTWTGTGSGMTINHNLGSAPGMIIMKKLSGPSGTGNWGVWHRGLPASSPSPQYSSNVFLNLTDQSDAYEYLSAAPTSTNFSVNNSFAQSSVDYVAYLFAHDAGGFGTSGTDNVISCGSFTADGSGNATVSLGYEPQWVMVKRTDSATNGSWWMFDTMREMSLTNSRWLVANTSAAEVNGGGTAYLVPTATGFDAVNSFFNASGTYIYMAIRRPMKVPTSGTTVFSTDITASASTSSTPTYSSGFVTDMGIEALRTGSSFNFLTSDRLRGQQALYTNRTDAEASNSNVKFDYMNGWGGWSSRSSDYMSWMFKRASGFMDAVCYTGTGSATTQAHNLGVVPELMIVKSRSAAVSWGVYTAPTGATNRLLLNSDTNSSASTSFWNDTAPTSSVFTVGTNGSVNSSGGTYVAYLFATLAGVSKVGSYTGNGGTQAIACGFTGGARFVLIKRTDSTGDWYVYDTARGMTLLTDPYLLLNTTGAEAATLGSVTTTAGGFTVNAAILSAINTNAASYIFLAIA